MLLRIINSRLFFVLLVFLSVVHFDVLKLPFFFLCLHCLSEWGVSRYVIGPSLTASRSPFWEIAGLAGREIPRMAERESSYCLAEMIVRC